MNPMNDSTASPPQPQNPSILQKFFFLVSARGFRELMVAVFFILLARQSTTLFGEFMLALGMGYLIRIVADFGLNQFLVPHLSKKQPASLHLLLQVSLIKGALFLLAWMAGLVFIVSQGYTIQLRQVMIIIASGVGLEVFSNTFFVVLQVRGRQKAEGVIKGAAAILGFGYGIVTLVIGLSPVAIAFFKIIETTILLIASGHMMVRDQRSQFKKQAVAGVFLILPQVFIFALIDVFNLATVKINLFFLQHHGGSDGVAQYSATWEIVEGAAILALELLLQSVLYPVFARLWHRDQGEAVRVAEKSFRWLMLAALIISAILYMESDRLIPLIYGSEYQDAIWLQKLLVLTVPLSFLQYLCAFLMMSMGHEKRLLIYYFIVLVVNVVLCMTLIPANPLRGSAWSIILTKFLVAFLTISHCQLQVKLITIKPLIQLVLACALSTAFYFIGGKWIHRELTEMFTVLPMIILTGYWWRRETALGNTTASG
jgi:O-antigen/teichoic acid export membrane protein